VGGASKRVHPWWDALAAPARYRRPVLAIIRKSYLMNVDIVVAVVLLAIVGYAAIDTSSGDREPEWVALMAATLIAGPISLRRFFPLSMLGVSLVATLAATTSGVIPLVAMGAPATALAILLYMVASEVPRRRSLLAFAVCCTATTTLLLASRLVDPAQHWEDTLFGFSFMGLVLAMGWTLGFATRERRRHAEESVARRAEQAVAEERLRIARELHDIVAHSMSVIAVKAGIGNHVADARPAEAREALRVIEATSRGSLAEMRQLLGVLRSEVDGPALAPAPSPAGIPVLVERARDAGVTAELSLDDTSGLPEGIGLSVYRITQEALTNVVRHAAPTRCVVTVAVDAEAVRVEVVNEGPLVDQGPGGHGLIGMRERVAVYGGTFTAGPREEGGWRVFAEMPL
jgi:signal transduction histidine kinase